MSNYSRRIFDFIAGGCAGFCLAFGGILGYGSAFLMLLTHIILVFREKILLNLEKEIKKDGVKNVGK